jgi:polar amino acid transport system substrate-binding protein
MKLFPFFSALLFATVAETAWSSDGPTKSQREEIAPTGKNRPNALAYATAFMEDVKASGMVRRALDEAGLKDLVVAPPAVR